MKIKTPIAILIVLVLAVIAIYGFAASKSKNTQKEGNPVAQYEVQTFQSKDKTWGYNVIIDGKLYVRQETIPAISGTKGFKTQKDASAVGQLIVSKIKKGIIPPTVTVEELKGLGIE
jgi:hypothetical protein